MLKAAAWRSWILFSLESPYPTGGRDIWGLEDQQSRNYGCWNTSCCIWREAARDDAALSDPWGPNHTCWWVTTRDVTTFYCPWAPAPLVLVWTARNSAQPFCEQRGLWRILAEGSAQSRVAGTEQQTPWGWAGYLQCRSLLPRGASSSSMGELVWNRELGARLSWRRGIVPLNYPLTPLTLGGAEGPYKSQLLLLPLLLLLLFFIFFF